MGQGCLMGNRYRVQIIPKDLNDSVKPTPMFKYGVGLWEDNLLDFFPWWTLMHTTGSKCDVGGETMGQELEILPLSDVLPIAKVLGADNGQVS